MAVPTDPTRTTLTTEGLKRAGYQTPSGALLNRAKEWMEEIKNDISLECRTFKSLMWDDIVVLQKGVSRYSNPTDYGDDIKAVLMSGNVYGTAQSAAAGTITLSASDSSSTDIIGKYILQTGGTNGWDSTTYRGQLRQIRLYDTSTKIATLASNWETTPTGTITYMIVESYLDLTNSPVWNYDTETYPTLVSKPSAYIPIGDIDDGEFLIYPAPDLTANASGAGYGLKIRYYVDLQRVDLAEGSTLISTLYRRWRNIWIQGVKYYALDYMDDNRSNSEYKIYRGMIAKLISREKYGMNMHNLQTTIGDN